MTVALPLAAEPAGDRVPVAGAIVFEGVNSLAEERLFPIYRHMLGEPFDEIQQAQLEQALADLYRTQGYQEPTEVVIRQVEANIWRVSVAEARVAYISVTGFGPSGNERLMALAQPVLKHRGALSERQLRIIEQRLERSAGRQVAVHLKASGTPEKEYYLEVTAPLEVQAELTYSAEGSDRLGRHLVAGEVVVENLAAPISEAYLSAVHTLESDSYRNFGAGFTLAPALDHRISLASSIARATEQEEAGEELYKRQWYRLRWHYQLIQSDQRELALGSSFTARDYTRDLDDVETVKERLRVAEMFLANRWRWQGRTLRWYLGGRQGINDWGAVREGPAASRDTDLGFGLVKSSATIWQRLPLGLSLRTDVGGQYTRDYLPFSERFSLGGSRYAKAYEPGEFSGDRGLGTKVEVRKGFDHDGLLTGRFVPYVYYGVARVFDNELGEQRSGASAGLGLRWLGEQARAYVEVGQPLTTESEYREDDFRATGRLTVEFP